MLWKPSSRRPWRAVPDGVGHHRGDGDDPHRCERLAVAFGRVVRGVGIAVSVDSVVLYARALALVDVADRDAVYWAGRSTLIRRREDIAGYERAFEAFWTRRPEVLAEPLPGVAALPGFDGPAGFEEDGIAENAADELEAPLLPVRWSPAEVLRERDFAAYTEVEWVEARRLMADLRFAGATRRSRRLRPAPRPTARPDLRRTVRDSLRTAGEPIRRAFLQPVERRRRLVLLLDVSGSMEPYSRAFVRLLHAAVASRGRVDAFAMGTRLTRVTRELRSRDPDAAVRAAARRVSDWSGGTRLGECLRAFNDTWGMPGMARGAVIVILSDGWDRGDRNVLGEQMARLRRVAHRIVWVNPLKASEGYAPLAGGMAAALPYVDDFVMGHSLDALEDLARVISK